MLRRRVLISTGIVCASITGCLSGAGDVRRTGTSEDGPTETTSIKTEPQRYAIGETAEFEDGTALTVKNPIVQESIVAHHSTFLSIERTGGLQYLTVDVTGVAEPDPASFALERNGAVEELPQPQLPVRSVIRECSGTCIGIPVAVEAVDSAAITYRSEEGLRAVWSLEDTTITALSRVPNLRLQDASITDHSGDIGIELAVENRGRREGVFLALVAPAWVADVEDPIGFTVPEGETVNETVVPNGIQKLDAGEAAFAEEPDEDTRRFEIERST